MNFKNIHLIAIGGAAMHNIALDLQAHGHRVTGSDDEIYNPSLTRLQQQGLAPEKFGWFPEKITTELDFVILGMHAKADNIELKKAQDLGIKVYSYPEFVFEHSKNKKRVVIAGSHGKTTTTAMILHVLHKMDIDFDFLVGAQLDGFDRMVKLSDAPLIIIEGDEYLSSTIDRIPKIHHYKPHISVLTGIAWDHINVFPTFELYKAQFAKYLDTFEENGVLIYYENDLELKEIVDNDADKLRKIPYSAIPKCSAKSVKLHDHIYPISIIGYHNLQNLNAARLVCQELGVSEKDFFEHISDFTGASKRLQIISKNEERVVFLDFAHAPSKVKATTHAVKDWFGEQKLLAVLELHTFSSLNKAFIPQYFQALQAADEAVVFYNEHTLKMKQMPELSEDYLKEQFGFAGLKIFTNEDGLSALLKKEEYKYHNILLMTSGNFNNMPLNF